ncbi:MAG: gliding motility-associated C-terminal domain-containing protein, partial [Bacteroidales bacterium]|nr:gliding motility-associated C-terminal domain-containing protein [Bacteroidales bacterium]
SAFVGTVVNINALAVTPDSAFTDRNNVCPGAGNITLSYSGGDPGTNGVAVWYADAALADRVGAGNDLIIAAPVISTTYFVRFEADCDTSSTASVTVSVISIPEPTFVEKTENACVNGPLYRYVASGQPGSLFTWNITNGTIVNNFNDTILVDWGGQVITGILELFETTTDGCISTPVTLQVDISGPSLELGENIGICRGTSETIIPEGDFASYLWQDGSTGSEFSTGQEGWITLKVSDSNGCETRDSIYLTLIELPIVDLGPDTSICGDAGIVLDAGSDGLIYRWSTGENSQEITVYMSERREIWVEVESEFGCISMDTVIVDECLPEIYFNDIPTAITPNDDGVNDVWNLRKLASYTQAEVEIFDRWGTLVWRSEPGYSEPWDGRNLRGNLVPMDSYHYVIELNVGSQDRVTGVVTVIR